MSPSSTQVSPEQVRADVQLMVGGHFTGVALGPEEYEKVLHRALDHVDQYLEAFENLYLGKNFDPITQSELYLPYFLQLMSEKAPERVRDLGEQLLKQYNAVLAFHDAVEDREALMKLLPEQTANLSFRFQDRREELRRLLQSLSG